MPDNALEHRKGGAATLSESIHPTPETILCERHGEREKAYVCEHLLSGERKGFVASVDQPGNPHPDAWCLDCDRIRLAHGGTWNAANESLVKVRLVCGECYEDIRALHRLGSEVYRTVQ